MDPKLEDELARFKRYREALIHSDAGELGHHLKDFIREIRRNSLTKSILADLPPFNVAEWWKQQEEAFKRNRRLSSLDYPDGDDERLVVLLDLAESMASNDPNQLSVFGLGQMFGKHKMADASTVAINLVLRPFATLLSDKLRKKVEVANPAVRELAGVPLNLIPADDEIRIFLSHKTIDKPLVMPYYEVLKELGLAPWLDEKDMRAGDVLHREITGGFDQSCAVVFFITENFRDERWLKHEVDQAVMRYIDRQPRFSIISLVFDGAEVPRPLKNYLYVNVKDNVSALKDLIRGLPIEVGPPRWRK